MHKCVPSHTTATPSGLIFSTIVSLLQLQAAGKDVDEPRDLAQPNHAPIRNIGDVTLAEERQQVVLAQAVEVDVPDDDHLVIIDAEQRAVEHFIDIG
jgi:hypothetical protein